MKNVIIINGANFASQAVETIELIDSEVFNESDYLYTDRHIQVTSQLALKESLQYYGGFLDVSQFKGDDFVLKNTSEYTCYTVFFKTLDFSTQIPSGVPCDGVSGLTMLVKNTSIEGVIPSDAGWIYTLVTNNQNPVTSELKITIPIT